jgi:hypothetical protein
MKSYRGVDVQSNILLTPALDGGWVVIFTHRPLYSPGKALHGIHWIGSLVSPRACLEGVQPAALSLYWATPAAAKSQSNKNSDDDSYGTTVWCGQCLRQVRAQSQKNWTHFSAARNWELVEAIGVGTVGYLNGNQSLINVRHCTDKWCYEFHKYVSSLEVHKNVLRASVIQISVSPISCLQIDDISQ